MLSPNLSLPAKKQRDFAGNRSTPLKSSGISRGIAQQADLDFVGEAE
jgi:hypothetical protein